MAQVYYSPVGPLHFAHPSTMTSFIPSSLCQKIRKPSSSFFSSSSTNKKQSNKSIKEFSISSPILTSTSNENITFDDFSPPAYTRTAAVDSSSSSTESSINKPSFSRASTCSFFSDDSTLYEIDTSYPDVQLIPAKLRAALAAQQIEQFERERIEEEKTEMIIEDARMGKALEQLGF